MGELVGARLIAHAGSLMTLAKYPASTVQILGAEKVRLGLAVLHELSIVCSLHSLCRVWVGKVRLGCTCLLPSMAGWDCGF